MTPGEIASWWQVAVAPLHDPTTETAAIVFLDADGHRLGHLVANSGSACAVVVPVRESFTAALRLGAVGLLLVHNHPPPASASPSVQDMQQALALRAGCRLVGLEFSDSLILGADGWFSFASNGWLLQAETIRTQSAGERAHAALGELLSWLETGKPGLTAAVVEEAGAAGVTPEQLLVDLLVDGLKRTLGASS